MGARTETGDNIEMTKRATNYKIKENVENGHNTQRKIYTGRIEIEFSVVLKNLK